MKSKHIVRFAHFLMYYLLMSLPVLAGPGSIWFNSPTNGATYYTNAGESGRWITINWNRILAYPGYYGELQKVWLDTEQLPDNTYPYVDRYVAIGSHTYRAELWQSDIQGQWVKTAETQISFTVLGTYNVTVQNSFGGGNVKVDGVAYTSGTTFAWRSGENHTLEAIDGQSSGGYVQRFSNWSGPGAGKGSIITITVSANATYRANFKKEFNIVFQNSFVGVGNGGVIKVNGVQYNSPTSSFPVVQDQSITAEAINQAFNAIEYSFSQWSDGTTWYSKIFTPTDHTTYTASFIGKPTFTPNVAAGGPPGTNVQITWSEHPNSNVTQYHLWRVVKHNGVLGNPSNIAVVNRGTTSYTDYDYVNTSGYTNDLLQYDVRPYYSIEGTTNVGNWVSAFGRLDARVAAGTTALDQGIEAPGSFSVLNYPNPFNPSTTIRFDLPEASFVRLRVFDVLGRVVAVLVEEEKPAGSHRITFDASNLPSGVYLYRLEAGNFTETKRMVLMK